MARRRRRGLCRLAAVGLAAAAAAAEEELAACPAGDGSGECLGSGGAGSHQHPYHWPHVRGRVSRYGASPHPGPGNLTVTPSWTWHHPQGRYRTIVVGGPLIDGESNIYLAAAEGIRKFSPDGQLLWTYTIAWATGLMATCPSIMDGALYGNTRNGDFFAVSMETGQELWSARAANGTNLDSASVEAHAGTVLAAADPAAKGGNLRVLALEASNGSLLWDFRPDAPLQNFMPFITANGTLVFQDQEATVYHLWLRNGSVIWKAEHRAAPEPAEPTQAAPQLEAGAPAASEPSPPEPTLPVRRGASCPEFPVAEGARLTLHLPNATGSSARIVHLWRRNDRPGGMVAMWFHRSSFTLLPWVRWQLLRPWTALFSLMPAGRGLVLLVYGCPLYLLLQAASRRFFPNLRGEKSPGRRTAPRLRWACHPLAPLLCLAAGLAPLVVLKLIWWQVQTGAVAYEAYGQSAGVILDGGGIILGFDGDFNAVPFYGWQSLLEEKWGESDDWRLIDEAVACAFERLPGLNPRRVHVAGFSAGGIVAAKAGFMRPQYIASVAPTSGFLVPLLRNQSATPRAGGASGRHHFAAMITVGGEDDFPSGYGPFEGPAARYPWQAVKVASQFLRDTMLSRGQLAFICDHGQGHDEVAPRAISGHLHRFFEDHPYGAASPYVSGGLPSSFNRTVCEETRGLGQGNGSWHYACCSHSVADADDRTHWFSMAHLQTLKRHEGIPDSVIPYMAPSNVAKYIEGKLRQIYGRADATVDPSKAGSQPPSIGVYDGGARTKGSCDPARMRSARGRRFTVGGVSLGPNGLVFAVSGHQTKLFLDLPGCLHAYRLDDGKLLWQQGLPHPAYRAAVGQLRGAEGLSVVIPTGKNPFFPGKLSFTVHVLFYAFAGLLASLLLALCRRCCFGQRSRLRSWSCFGLLVGTVAGCALGAARLLVSNPRPTEVWAFEAETGRLQWRFEAPLWTRMAAAGDDEGLSTRIRLGWFRTICLPSAWSSPTIDGNGTVYIGHMSGKLYAIFGDLDGDGVINGSAEVSSFDAGSGFPPPGPSLAPGMLAAASCDSLHVFR